MLSSAYHWTHARSADSEMCFGCVESIAGDQTLDPDGRVFCEACAVSRLLNRAELAALWSNVCWFVTRVLRRPSFPVVLHVLAPDELAARLGGSWSGQLERTLGRVRYAAGQFDVFVEAGLPRDLAAEVLAHELGHIWYMQHGRHDAPEALSEGFAQWVAYGACRHLGYLQQMRRVLSRPGAMGDGVRQLLALQRQHGRHAVMSCVAPRLQATARKR